MDCALATSAAKTSASSAVERTKINVRWQAESPIDILEESILLDLLVRFENYLPDVSLQVGVTSTFGGVIQLLKPTSCRSLVSKGILDLHSAIIELVSRKHHSKQVLC